MKTRTYLIRLQQARHRLDTYLGEHQELPGGPMGTVIDAIQTILSEALQGSNQAGTDEEVDTCWSDEELYMFDRAATPLLDLVDVFLNPEG